MKSEILHIRVVEGDQTHIELTFCASLTEHLPRLLPGALRRKLAGRDIDPACLGAEARANDFPPGELFSFDDGARKVRAWLE